jgi:hypothetical protein
MSLNKPDYIDDWQICSIPYCEEMSYLESNGLQLEKIVWSIIPAWSLHRLMEILALCPYEIYPRDNVYKNIIDDIEEAIKDGLFNTDYLEDKK